MPDNLKVWKDPVHSVHILLACSQLHIYSVTVVFTINKMDWFMVTPLNFPVSFVTVKRLLELQWCAMSATTGEIAATLFFL